MGANVIYYIFSEPPWLFLIFIMAIILLILSKSFELIVISLERLGLIESVLNKLTKI